jgi:hypothetical protein
MTFYIQQAELYLLNLSHSKLIVTVKYFLRSTLHHQTWIKYPFEQTPELCENLLKRERTCLKADQKLFTNKRRYNCQSWSSYTN